ncbi:MAG: hypothetical protein U9R75_03700, partial [Candidatus Thermoplasmatota archaeon]|nr:hypothetical protein [Candidatus Thermoplasmatota archaeon]
MRSGRVFLAKANSLAFTLIMVLTLFLVMYPSDLSTSAEPLERPEDVRTIQLVFSGIGISDTQISMDGEGRLDLVWVDVRDGNEEIYFLKTETNGWKLHDDMRLTVSTDRSIMPTLCPTKGYTTTLAWVEETITGLHTLMTTTLKYDGGDIFLIAEPRSIVSDVHLSGCPVLKPSDNGNAYIMWAEGLVDNRSCVRMAEIDPLSNDKPTPQVVFPNLGSINYIDFEPLSGSDFIASWNGQYIPDGSTDVNYGIFFTRFTLGGEVHVQPVRKSITSSDTRPDIDHFDGAISIVFSTRRYAYQDVLFTSFDMNGSDIIDDTPISDLISNNIDPSLSIGQDGTYSVIWSRGSNVSWTMVCLGLDPTALQSGSIIPEILAENTVSPGHPPSQ